MDAKISGGKLEKKQDIYTVLKYLLPNINLKGKKG